MTFLCLGLLLWTGAHMVGTASPALRARLADRLGAGPARGAFAVAILLSVALMAIGYRAAPYVALWTPPAWAVHVNNLLMVAAVFLFAASHSKSRARAWMRHPQLAAAVLWAVAHLMVNGDLASLILFGGIGAWALASMAAINRRDGPWTRPTAGTAKGDVRLVLTSAVMFAVIVAVHTWLGYPPFR